MRQFRDRDRGHQARADELGEVGQVVEPRGIRRRRDVVPQWRGTNDAVRGVECHQAVLLSGNTNGRDAHVR